MAVYLISGLWKNVENIITHYAVHTVGENSITKARKIPKSQVINMLEKPGNLVTTCMWNYNSASWSIGEPVNIVNGENGKYLRSNPDNGLTDHLAHLVDFDWILY